MINNGQDLAEIQRLQQKQLEEMTLYIIEQGELIKQQKAKLEALENKLKAVTSYK